MPQSTGHDDSVRQDDVAFAVGSARARSGISASRIAKRAASRFDICACAVMICDPRDRGHLRQRTLVPAVLREASKSGGARGVVRSAGCNKPKARTR